MRTILLAVSAAILAAGPANAEPPSQSMLAGGEIRRNVEFSGIRRYEVLKLAPDGTFTGVFEKSRHIDRLSVVTRSGSMRGRWSLEGGELCFEGGGLEYQGRSCYRLTKGGYSKNEWSGIQTSRGDVWQFFVYPPSN